MVHWALDSAFREHHGGTPCEVFMGSQSRRDFYSTLYHDDDAKQVVDWYNPERVRMVTKLAGGW